MIPIFSKIENFGPHSETEFDWSNLGRLAAIVGKNWNGKTFLIEAPFAALFGFFPSRGSLVECIRWGSTGGSVELVFEHEGKPYRAARTTKMVGVAKSAKSTATLMEIKSYDPYREEPIAGPKVGDFDAAIYKMVGDAKFAQATWFAAQGARADLVEIPQSERREVLGDLCGLGELQKRSERFREKARSARTFTESLATQIEANPMDRIKADWEALDTAIIQNDEELEILKGETEGLIEAIDTGNATIEFFDQLGRVRSIEADAADWQRQADGAAEHREKAATLEAVEETLAELNEAQAQGFAFTTWSEVRTTIATALKHGELALEAFEPAKIQPGDNELAELIEDRKAAMSTATAAVTQKLRLEDKRATVEMMIEEHGARIERLERKVAKRPDTPAADEDCDKCLLMKDWSAIPGEIQEAKNKVGEKRDELLDIADELKDIGEPDLEKIRAEIDASQAALDRVNDANRADSRKAELVAVRDEAAGALAEHDNETPGEPDRAVSTAELDKANADVSNAKAAEFALEAAGKAGNRAADRRASAEKLFNDVKTGALASIYAAESDPGPLPTMYADCEAQSRVNGLLNDKRREERARLDREIRTREMSQARNLEAGEAIKKRREDHEAKSKRVRELEADAADFETLAEAFGPRGIQALILDAALPEIERYAQELITIVSDGGLSVRIVTQEITRSGDRAEKIQILYRNAKGEADIKMGSGAEKRIIRTAVMLGLARWQAAHHGSRVQFLAIDESFDALDDENAALMVEALNRIKDHYELVVVITHNRSLAERLPARALVEEHFSGVNVLIESAA